MKALQQLEEHILRLLKENKALKEEKEQFFAEKAEKDNQFADEYKVLLQQLQEERNRNADALTRVEGLLQLIKEHAAQAPDHAKS